MIAGVSVIVLRSIIISLFYCSLSFDLTLVYNITFTSVWCSVDSVHVCIPGYVTGHSAGSGNKTFMSLINLNTLRLHNVLPSDHQSFANSCQKKKFIVKAQLPISKNLFDSSIFCIRNISELRFYANVWLLCYLLAEVRVGQMFAPISTNC